MLVGDIGDDILDGDSAVDAPQLARRGDRLRQHGCDIILVVEQLALEVVELDEVAVDQPQRPTPARAMRRPGPSR